MIIKPAPVGCRIVDSLQFSQTGTASQAQALKAAGCEGVAGYLGVMSAQRLKYVLDTGMGCLPVTLAGEYLDGGVDEVAQLHVLQVPLGASVVLDMEGLDAYNTDPHIIIDRVNAWASAVGLAGYVPWLYVGSPQPLTSDQLWKLQVRGYWRGQGRIVDHSGALAEPTGCGWSMVQAYPSVTIGAVLVDCNQVSQDYKGRVPMMVYT